MRGFLTILSPTDYDKWYAGEVAKKAAQLAPPTAALPPAAPSQSDSLAAGAAPSAAAAPRDSLASTSDTAAH
jgi:hypothetical protein